VCMCVSVSFIYPPFKFLSMKAGGGRGALQIIPKKPEMSHPMFALQSPLRLVKSPDVSLFFVDSSSKK